MSHRRLRSASKELLQYSPEFIISTTAPMSGGKSHRKTPASAEAASDYESCNSSLQSLNFDSDPEHQKSVKKSTRTKATSLSARKKLQFEKMLDLDDGNRFQSPRNKIKTTPTSYLKTPTENGPSINNTPPKRTSHGRRPLTSKENYASPKNVDVTTDLSSDDFDIDLGQKRLRSDLPKVRMSLFNDSPDRVIPVKSFYSKTDKNVMKFRSSPEISKSEHSNNSVKESKSFRQRSFTYKNSSRRNKNEINRGVRHGIRKPKHNKKSYLSKARALKLSLDLIDNSPLNDYIEKFMNSNVGDSVMKNSLTNIGSKSQDVINKTDSLFACLQANTSKIKQFQNNYIAETISYSDDDENNENVDSLDENRKKKFFKFSQGLNKKATVKLPGVKLQVKSGKLIMPRHKMKPLNEANVIDQNFAKHYAAMHKDVTELLNDEDGKRSTFFKSLFYALYVEILKS